MRKIIYILLFILALTSCQKGRTYFPKDLKPQELEIVRFDNALINVHKPNPDPSLKTRDEGQGTRVDIRVLYDEYPEFMPLWVEDILGIPSADTAFLEQQLPLFLNDTLYGFKQTNAREQEIFADVRDLEQAIGKAFGRIEWLYPETEVPTFYLFISGFQTPIYFGEGLIGIGADMYLGSDYEYYNRVVYEYQKQTMRYRGKVMYLTAQIFDNLKGHEVMGWTKEQWEWCVKNERAIWHLVMDKRDLFKTENLVLTGYLNDGPFTSEVSQDAPGRLGIWLGWRIAQSYMEHNETVTLQDLMAEGDAQKILEDSYYKP